MHQGAAKSNQISNAEAGTSEENLLWLFFLNISFWYFVTFLIVRIQTRTMAISDI